MASQPGKSKERLEGLLREQKAIGYNGLRTRSHKRKIWGFTCQRKKCRKGL